MTKQFSIIGCQHAHMADFIQEMTSMGYTCAGIYDAGDPWLVNRLAKKYQLPVAQNMEMLLGPTVQFVGSSAISNEKIDIIELCEKHGKHIMLDKPAVTNREGLNRLKSIISRGNIQVGMQLTERVRPGLNALKKIMDAGVLGKIVSVSMRKPHRLDPSTRPPYHFSKKQSGGIIIDLFIHDVDLLRWLTSKEIVTIHSTLVKNILPEYPSFYDAASANMILEDGIIAQIYADWHTPDKSWTGGDSRIFICGTEGNAEMRLNGDPAIANRELLFIITNEEPFKQIEFEPIPLTVSQDFVDRTEGKSGFITHVDIIQASEKVIEATEKAVMIPMQI